MSVEYAYMHTYVARSEWMNKGMCVCVCVCKLLQGNEIDKLEHKDILQKIPHEIDAYYKLYTRTSTVKHIYAHTHIHICIMKIYKLFCRYLKCHLVDITLDALNSKCLRVWGAITFSHTSFVFESLQVRTRIYTYTHIFTVTRYNFRELNFLQTQFNCLISCIYIYT